ncbi:hypothetical protein ONZ43_g6437 [Nemania bipapillata]|uniref:Uncharacterized protein n=1 Tax=Nemania bipapillata TaxID=110536 RepID=A0ACC2HZ95_9PEZI|nr:hypothetical protein ONZ43_g6437 [Nemania bipapillata]
MHVLREGLKSSQRTSFAVYGLGGVGKTQLALKYVHDYGHLYRQIFWIVADSDIKIREAFIDLCPRLVPDLGSKASLDKCVQLVREWLSSNSEYLLVFDNADDPETLKPYWPVVKGSILVTSRGPLFVEQKIVAGGFELPTLTPTEGATFLLEQLDADEPEGSTATTIEEGPQRHMDASEISRRLGGQLLALAHMASWIRETRSSLTEFLCDHDDEESKTLITLDYKASGAVFNYQWSYATCWSLSFSRVEGTPAARILAGSDITCVTARVAVLALSPLSSRLSRPFTKLGLKP